MLKKLYTFVMDYEGGTYLSQVESSTKNQAKYLWALNFNLSVISVEEIHRDRFVQSVKEEEAVAIVGLKRVWCISPDIQNKIATVHFIETISGR